MALELETTDWAAAITMANEDLDHIVGFALAGRRKSQNYLKKLWPECNWPTIKKRLQTKGSAWYVWWVDGVNQHLANITS